MYVSFDIQRKICDKKNIGCLRLFNIKVKVSHFCKNLKRTPKKKLDTQ